eukprot:COSAG01_NODE_33713_length_559_cov_0.271150_1_plen_89_part_00
MALSRARMHSSMQARHVAQALIAGALAAAAHAPGLALMTAVGLGMCVWGAAAAVQWLAMHLGVGGWTISSSTLGALLVLWLWTRARER